MFDKPFLVSGPQQPHYGLSLAYPKRFARAWTTWSDLFAYLSFVFLSSDSTSVYLHQSRILTMASFEINDSDLTGLQGKVAIITLNQPKKLNALNQDLYFALAKAMHEVAARDDIYITVLTGKGRYFSA